MIVRTLVVPVVAGLNTAVTPLGKPVTASEAVPLNPFFGVSVMVLFIEAPCRTLSEAGEAASVKPVCDAVIVTAIATVEVRLPDFPVTVMVDAPAAALAPATKLNVLVVAVDAGANDAVTPAGNAEIVRLTVPVNPLVGATVIVAAPELPCATLSAEADDFNVYPAGPESTRLKLVFAVIVPDTPWIASA